MGEAFLLNGCGYLLEARWRHLSDEQLRIRLQQLVIDTDGMTTTEAKTHWKIWSPPGWAPCQR